MTVPATPSSDPRPPTRIERPVFIVSSPRSGSSLLFRTLMQAPDAYTIGGESHQLIETMNGLHPSQRGWSSNRLEAADATPAAREELAGRFTASLRDRAGGTAAGPVRMVEKTPKNSLRIPFLDRAFPDGIFVYLYRDARQTLHSMIEAWHSGGFRTYPALPGWPGLPWSLLLVPGWQDLRGRPLPEIVARQWKATTDMLLDDLAGIPADRVRALAYDDLVAAPQATIEALCRSLDLRWDRQLGPDLPLSPTVVSAPRADKWRRIEPVIEAVWSIVADTDQRARQFLGEFRAVPLAS